VSDIAKRALSRSALIIAVLSASWSVADAARAEDSLDELAERAAALPEGPPRFVTNYKQGIRAAIYSTVVIAPSDPSVIYVTSMDGYVFGTQDNGVTWNEGRLIIKRRRFYGSIRPAPISSGAPFSVQDNISDLHSHGRLTFDIDNLLIYPPESTGSQLLDVSIDTPAFYPTQAHPMLRDPSDIKLYDEAGAGGGGGDLARLGVGLKTAAVYLAALLRKRHKRILTMNLQLTLAVKGSEPTGIQYSAVHPQRPNEILAASYMGLWRSEDFGMSWILAFPGATRKERTARHISYRPDDPSQVLLSTDQGLRVSSDGGLSFEAIKGTQLSTAATHWVEWSPSQPDTVYAGTTIGAFRSDDGGRTWRWIYFETLPTQNYVTAIAVDPHDHDRVTLSTLDGLFQTSDGGETWLRAGGLLFTGVKVRDISTNPKDGRHMVCITHRQVWETRDWGDTWQAVYLNDSEWWFRDVRFDTHEDGVFWLVSTNEILKVSPTRGVRAAVGGLAAYKARLAVEPSLWESMEATFRQLGVHLGDHGDIRAKASPSAWLPDINIMGGAFAGHADASIAHNLISDANAVLVTPEPDESQEPDALFQRTQVISDFYIFAMLSWDFGRATFDLDSVPYGRIFNTASYRYRKLRAEVQRLYEERRRLLLDLLTSPKRDLASDLFLRLRLEELTAHLNTFTGGLWEPAAQWLAALP
jgi:hypothetical protein